MITVKKYRNGGKKDFSIQKSRANLYFVWEGAKCLRENLSTMEESEHQINQIILNRKKSALEAVTVKRENGEVYQKKIKPMKKNVQKECVECGKSFVDDSIVQVTKVCSDECRKARGAKSSKKYNDKYQERLKANKLKAKEDAEHLKSEMDRTVSALSDSLMKGRVEDASSQAVEYLSDRLEREGFAKGITDAWNEQTEKSMSELSNEVLDKAIASVLLKAKHGQLTVDNFFTEVFDTLISIDPKYQDLLISEENQDFVKRFQSVLSDSIKDLKTNIEADVVLGKKWSSAPSEPTSTEKLLESFKPLHKEPISLSEKIKVEKWEKKALQSEVEAYASMLTKVLQKLWENSHEDYSDLVVKISKLTPYTYRELVDVCNHYAMKVRLDKWSALEEFLAKDLLVDRGFFPSTEQKTQMKQILKELNDDDGFNLKSYVFDHFVDVKDRLKLSNDHIFQIKAQLDKVVGMIGRSDDTVNQLGHVINKNEDSIEKLAHLCSNSELTLERKIEHNEGKIHFLATKIESLENRIEMLVSAIQSVTVMLQDNKKKGWFNK
jgi:predicted transposase